MNIWGRLTGRREPSGELRSQFSPIVVEQLESRILLSVELPGMHLVDPVVDRFDGQVIHLDFDGQEDVTYNGPVVVEDIDVPVFRAPDGLAGQEDAIIADVVASLNDKFADASVTFTATQPIAESPYSTIYVGGTDAAFAEYGSFLGLAEQVDAGNATPDDIGFVFSDEIVGGLTADGCVYELSSAIAHEAGHLVGFSHSESAPLETLGSPGESASHGLLDAVAYAVGEDKEVHQYITKEAYDFYVAQFGLSELGTYLSSAGSASSWDVIASASHEDHDNNIIEGARDEDSILTVTIPPVENPFGQDFPWLRHFSHGGDGSELLLGLDDWYIPGYDEGANDSFYSGYEQAEHYYSGWGSFEGLVSIYDSGNRASAYYYLGHIAHLLEDFTVPAHVHGDVHAVGLPSPWDDLDYYEKTTAYSENYELWGYGNGSRGGPVGDIPLYDSLQDLFQTTADYTEEYPSWDMDEHIDGPADDEPGIPNDAGKLDTDLLASRHRPSEIDPGDGLDIDDYAIVADDLMPFAMEQTAALYRLFYSEVAGTTPSVSITNLVQHDPNNPGFTFSPTIEVIAAASDEPSGVRYTFQYKQKAPNGSWSGWQDFYEGTNSRVHFNGTNEYTYGFRVRVENGAGNSSYSDASYVKVTAREGDEVSIVGQNWDDGETGNNENGVMEAGERVRLQVKLRSTADITDVNATLLTSDNDIAVTDSDVYYQSFSAWESQWPIGWQDMHLDFSNHRDSNFTLHVTYEMNGEEYYQDLGFSKTFYEWGELNADFEVIPPVVIDDDPSYFFRNNGDGILQTGEEVRIRPQVRNSGTSDATDPDVEFYYTGSGNSPLEITGSDKRYEDLSPGEPGYPEDGRYFRIYANGWSFTGSVDIGMRVDWDENNDPNPVEIPDVFQLTVAPAPIIYLGQDDWDFGVLAPGEPVTYSMRVNNGGSGPLTVTDIQTSHGDTSVPAGDKSFTLASGEFRDVVVTINTSAIPSGSTISRTITVTSDGRLADNTPPSNQVVITGLISNDVPIFQVPRVAEQYRPDVSGDWIVYSDGRNGNNDIFAYRISTGTEIQVTSNPAHQDDPRISGDLIVWMDLRNWDGQTDTRVQGYDIFGYDMATGQEFSIATGPLTEMIIGVDDGLIALSQGYEILADSYGADIACNLLVYEYQGNGQLALRYTTGWTPGSGTSARQTAGGFGDGDFGDGLLVYDRGYWDWFSEAIQYWQSNSTGVEKIDFGKGETSPTSISSINDPYSTTQHQFVYLKWYEDPDGNDGEQVWVWDDGSVRRLTEPGTEEVDHGDNVLAMGRGGFVVYDKSETENLNKVFYWDLNADQGTYPEALLTQQVLDPEEARMDGNTVVFLGRDPTDSKWYIYYAFLGQADLSVSSGDIDFSNTQPVEGQSVNVTVTVHNVNPWDTTDDVTLRLYNGDPDTGGTPWGDPEVVSGVILARGNDSVTFAGLQVPVGWEGARDIYAKVSIPSGDNPGNNKASKSLQVQDSDTEAPVISDVVVAEYDGDGHAIIEAIGADEQIQISWNLTDVSGIGSTQLWVDADGDGLGAPGNRDPDDEVVLDGDYYAIFGALNAGAYQFAIDATDADNTPESSQHTGTFTVAPGEKIRVDYDGHPLVNGDPGPIDLGMGAQGDPGPMAIFIVRNDGEQALALGAISVPDGFTVTGPASSIIPEGGLTHFTVTLDTSELGVFEGPVSVANSDLDDNPFVFNVTGEVRLGPRDLVTRFYQYCLGRLPDTDGLNNWVADLVDGTKTGAELAVGFMFSIEYIDQGNSDEQFVDTSYRAFFGREPDAPGKANWLELLAAGAPREDVLYGFVYSPEFTNLAAQYGIAGYSQDGLRVYRVRQFVTRFYVECLDRQPDADGLGDWTADLLAKTKAGADVAFGFMFSQEYLNQNTNNDQFVTTSYRAFFAREPDAGGFNNWIGALAGGASRLDVLKGFTDSLEFANLCSLYDILPNLA